MIYVNSLFTFVARFLVDGNPVAPETVTFVITKPDASIITKAYPADVEVVRTAMNEFTIEQTLDQAGAWRWEATPTGELVAPLGGGIQVQPLPAPATILTTTGASVTVRYEGVVIAGGIAVEVGEGQGGFTFYHPPNIVIEASVEAEGYFPLVQSFEVGNEAESVTATLSAIEIPEFSPPKLVTVYGYVSDVAGRGKQGVRVAIESAGRELNNFMPMPSAEGIDAHRVGVANERLEIVTNDHGFWFARLAVGILARVTIPSLRFDRFFTVPDDEGVTQLNIRDARTMPGPGGELNVVSDTPTFDTLKGVS